MSAPAADLSLPSDSELMGAAAPNPEREAARAVRGDPERIRCVGRQLMTVAAELDGLYGTSLRVQRELAGGVTVDGAAVYDEGLHQRWLPAGFRDTGTRLHDVGRRLGAVADELVSTIGDVTGSLERLRAELARRRSAFAAEVSAATADGWVPVESVGRLQARRDAVARAMKDAADACGREVRARVGRYDGVLGGCLPVIGELRAVAPPSGGADVSGVRLHTVLGGRFEAGRPAPPMPTVETVPIPEPRPLEPGFTPVPVGPGPLITLPAPGLGGGRQDGPGSGQRVVGPPIQIDRAAGNGAEPPSEPRINPGQQGKHIPGHPNFSPERSRLVVDPAELLDRVGTGEPVGSIPSGQPGHRERVDFGRPIGEYVDRDGNARPTSIGIVHHRMDGSVHIVPGRPR